MANCDWPVAVVVVPLVAVGKGVAALVVGGR